jgi:glycosyltransferase involved in cell wall biosynthesis
MTGAHDHEVAPPGELDVSIVLPCLDEAETVGICVAKARASASQLGLRHEVIVADNGSSDGSREIADAAGARVVDVAVHGYGAALSEGISVATGRYVIIADADDSYALDDLGPFVDALDAGADLVMGNRFAGGIAPGAMPRLHRYVGNPVLSAIGRRLFRTPIHDFHCGMRGFDRQAILDLDLRTTGMEFASEMVAKASLRHLDVREVPTTLRPDGRTRSPHLRTWRDGWRHLRFMLLLSPRWLLLVPGLTLLTVGVVGMMALLRGPLEVGSVELDIHALLYSHLALLTGLHMVFIAAFARVYAARTGLLPEEAAGNRLIRSVRLEYGLVLGLILIVIGIVGSVFVVWTWGADSFGDLDASDTMRIVVPSVTAVAVGSELMIAGFVLGVLNLDQR